MLISVCVISYNHENYIAQTLEGILLQQTNFEYEIVVGEDCSKDKTRAILRNYQEKYPNKIRLLFPEKNLGMIPNLLNTLKACKGKYIALCEGDDYWTDPQKLQLQVDELEKDSSLSFVFHKVDVYSEERKKVLYQSNNNEEKVIYNTQDLIKKDWFIMTCSIVFRKDALPFPKWFWEVVNGDYTIQLLCSLYGPGKYINRNMGLYRLHSNGASVTILSMEKGFHTLSFVLDKFNELTHFKFNKEVNFKKLKLRTRVVEEFAYALPYKAFFEKEYWQNYSKLLRYSNLSNLMHWKYLIRFALPFKSKFKP